MRSLRLGLNATCSRFACCYHEGMPGAQARPIGFAGRSLSTILLLASRPALVAWPRNSQATKPTNITGVVSNSTLILSWPTGHLGWILQAQTNHAGLGPNWVNVEGSSSSTIHHIPISPANPSVFYRLGSP